MGLRWRCAVLLAGLAAIVGLSACGARDGGKRLAGATAQQQGAEEVNRSVETDRQGADGDRTGTAGNDLQSHKDKELVLLFVALLQMDKKPELALTAAEAAVILPVVKAGKDKGELSPDEKQTVLTAMTAEQARFLTEFRDRVMAGRKKLRELSPEERAAMIKQFEKQRRQEDQISKPGGGELDAAAKPAGGALRSGAADGKAGDRTLEQQLLELLEAKLSHSGDGVQQKQ